MHLIIFGFQVITIGPQTFSLNKPFGFYAILVNFSDWQKITPKHSTASVKSEKHDEMQFELNRRQWFEGGLVKLRSRDRWSLVRLVLEDGVVVGDHLVDARRQGAVVALHRLRRDV